MLKSCLLSLDKVNWLIKDSCHSCALEGQQINSLSHWMSTKSLAKIVFLLFQAFTLPDSSPSSMLYSILHRLVLPKTNFIRSNFSSNMMGRKSISNTNYRHNHNNSYPQSTFPSSMEICPNRSSILLQFRVRSNISNHMSSNLMAVMISIFVPMIIN